MVQRMNAILCISRSGINKGSVLLQQALSKERYAKQDQRERSRGQRKARGGSFCTLYYQRERLLQSSNMAAVFCSATIRHDSGSMLLCLMGVDFRYLEARNFKQNHKVLSLSSRLYISWTVLRPLHIRQRSIKSPTVLFCQMHTP